MEDSFFGFNTSLPGLLDEELHDEPGQGLDEEEEEEYDALNDETFGTDAVEGDWEEDHEKLAEITEQSRARCGSYGAERLEEAEPDSGLELEASLAQLVLDDYDEDEDVIVENGAVGTKLQNHRQVPIVTADSYSSSAPSGYSVWTPTKQESQLQSSHQMTPSILPGKNVVSVEELERGLLSLQHNQHSLPLKQQHPLIVPPPGLGAGPSSVLRLEDVERDLTANATLPVHLGRGQTQLVQHPDMVILRNTQNAAAAAAAVASLARGPFPGRLPPPPKAQVLSLNRGQVMLPGGRIVGPSGVHPGLPGIPDLRQLPQQNHRLMGSAPNLLRFIPPHLMVPPGQGQGGKGIPHPAGFPGDNGLLFPNHPLGPFRPGLPHVDQHRPGGQGIYGPRQDRPGSYFSNNRNGGLNSNYQHPNRSVYHHQYNHNRGGNLSNQEYDEYAGLMTTREKHWLLNIQILQLNTDRPHIDDYYYTVFQSRQPKSEQDRERDRKRDVHRERRDSFREREPRQDSQPRVYTPAQFENSLGKLQIGSVTAPRKIIDMDVVSPEGLDTVPTSNQRDTRRAKQVLLEIERLYVLLLQIEDLSSVVPGVRESVTEEKSVLIQRIMNPLLVEDRVVSVMSFRKGKMLILRFLPHLPTTDNGPPQLLTLWSRLLRGLITIGRRDQGSDAVLPRFHPYFHSWVTTLPFAPLLQLARSMLPIQAEGNTSTPIPTRTASPIGRNVLGYAMSNKFGVSALASMLNRAEMLFSALDISQQQEWRSFLRSLYETATHIQSPDTLPAPLEPLSQTLASQHFKQLECVHVERYSFLEHIFTRRDSLTTSGNKSNENLT